jgi:hypothetical protein
MSRRVIMSLRIISMTARTENDCRKSWHPPSSATGMILSNKRCHFGISNASNVSLSTNLQGVTLEPPFFREPAMDLRVTLT